MACLFCKVQQGGIRTRGNCSYGNNFGNGIDNQRTSKISLMFQALSFSAAQDDPKSKKIVLYKGQFF